LPHLATRAGIWPVEGWPRRWAVLTLEEVLEALQGLPPTYASGPIIPLPDRTEHQNLLADRHAVSELYTNTVLL